ncbi:MAG: pilus assembly protein [Microthrixaceae bacterium]|nr:pilus assembly protein [Microthrixaceae bacterium]
MRASDRGQATVELAVLLPVVVLMMLVLVQGVLVIRDRLFLINAARVSARAAALDPTSSAMVDALDANGVASESLSVELDGSRQPGSVATVTVTRRVSRVPVIGGVLGDVELSERLAFRIEDSGDDGA